MEGIRLKIPIRIPVVQLKNGQGLGKRFGKGKGFEEKLNSEKQIEFQKRFRIKGHGSKNENKSSVAFGFKLKEYTFYNSPQTLKYRRVISFKGGDAM
jgi:hypothetical protein